MVFWHNGIERLGFRGLDIYLNLLVTLIFLEYGILANMRLGDWISLELDFYLNLLVTLSSLLPHGAFSLRSTMY